MQTAEVQNEDVLEFSSPLAKDMRDSFLAYMKHMVNPSLKGLVDYMRDEVRHYRPSKKVWHMIENYTSHLWNNRER